MSGDPPCIVHSLAFVADFLSVSRRTVERLVASGELDSFKVRGRRLVPARSLYRYVDALLGPANWATPATRARRPPTRTTPPRPPVRETA